MPYNVIYMYISHLLALLLRLIPDTPYLPRMLVGPFSAVVLASGFSIKISLSSLPLLPEVSPSSAGYIN